MPSIIKEIESTRDLRPVRDPFQKIIGQQKAISLVKSAVAQRRHILLCGVPGIGKSMIAKAAQSLLSPPKTEVYIQENAPHPERPQVFIRERDDTTIERSASKPFYQSFIRPEDLPFEIAVKMGLRCPRCKALCLPEQKICMDCGSPKRSEWQPSDSYQGLLHALDVISEPALETLTIPEILDGIEYHTNYRRSESPSITVSRTPVSEKIDDATQGLSQNSKLLISRDMNRFVCVSGRSPAELLGDVKHDPYGAAEELAKAPYERVVPGAIHEAHEGILYVDELAALGEYQKHLLTAMQDGFYPILGHNPHSSGASIRVDAVPCNFILFASCNPEDIEKIIPPLRSRIRGYGYEIMLNATMEHNSENASKIIRFAAQTIYEDGRIPHISRGGLDAIIDVASDIAYHIDGQKDALTLRLRELGGVIRVAGDLTVQSGEELISSTHVEEARELVFGLEGQMSFAGLSTAKQPEPYGDYFF